MSSKPVTSFELGATKKPDEAAPTTPTTAPSLDDATGAASTDYRILPSTTRYGSNGYGSCRDLALLSMRCQERLAPGTSRGPCHGNVYIV